MKTILVTGGSGFIGGHFLTYSSKAYPNHLFINLDKSSAENRLQESENSLFVQGDILDKGILETIFSQYSIQGVIHFAAETHVDNSILGPEIFIDTNVKGTFNLLEEAKKHWMREPFHPKPEYANARFHHISTDEVYGSLGEKGSFSESSLYAPNNPYSASKASSDLIVRSYHKTFGINTIITHCSNNFGPAQHDEKLIPTIVAKALKSKVIPIYGNGKNVRDWLYVRDHCRALDKAFHFGRAGEIYNVGGNSEYSNIDLALKICRILDTCHPKSEGSSYVNQISFVKDRPGHDWRYSIDSSKIQNELGWRLETTFEQALEETVKWYCAHYFTDLQVGACR